MTSGIVVVENRLKEVEGQVQKLLEVCAAVADDTLRVCFVLDELTRAGQLPNLPWETATMLVELHHALQAAKDNLTETDGSTATQKVEAIKAEVLRLRAVYQESLQIPGPDHET